VTGRQTLQVENRAGGTWGIGINTRRLKVEELPNLFPLNRL